MVQRYNPDYVMHAARFAPFAREAEHGEYVKFSDYEALVSELASSRQINAQTLQVKLTMAETIKELTDRVNALAASCSLYREAISKARRLINVDEMGDADDVLAQAERELSSHDAALAAIEIRVLEKFADSEHCSQEAHGCVCSYIDELREAK
ncbi:Uncharacterised protein [Serratia marcescens]|uniref:hypothetical protein n=1 Tax=Serratia marcescens TaxID=615 RepID=UPI000745429B|nr:hypothetical protein [Serratia marcescens]CVH63890.1 Uncharacterised protein [Serratia marcescens]